MLDCPFELGGRLELRDELLDGFDAVEPVLLLHLGPVPGEIEAAGRKRVKKGHPRANATTPVV